MTRFKDYPVVALALILSLAAFGLFASVGLAVLGILALVGLATAAAAWIATAIAPKNDTAGA